ncbi:SDR family oxidoreductase [Archangium violaceum]|uniref:SDR family NAD(P)-dependent oxidoreductase n=1 Tax=Archangium violaceum TaxID=83451 RepID=UPI00193B5191|nr:SDR family oxidoreductase [Archangium violaceum]QRK12071.1 SDR family oxidoreductase [Archangium violaceum]
MRFAGKSAVITGGSEGIGFAIAAGLVEEGARVVLVARREDKLVEAVGKLGPRASYVVGDASKAETAERAVEAAVSRHGGLDLLVNNAGTLRVGGIGALSLEDVDTMFSVNVRGTVVFTNAAVKALSGRPGAAILIISSSAGRRTVPYLSIYGATKAAVQHMAQTWAIELANRGIRVNCLSPGGTRTPAFDAAEKVMPTLEQDTIESSLIKRVATPEEVARHALMLLDEKTSGFVTGAIWDVDGGYQLHRSRP